MRRIVACSAFAMFVVVSTSVFAGPTPAQKCEASKAKTSGNYLKCLHGVHAKAAVKGGSPDTTKCGEKFVGKWDGAETKGEGSCPDDETSETMGAAMAGMVGINTGIIDGDHGDPFCGDGVVNAVGEQCDGDDTGGTFCDDLGYGSGSLLCSSSCRFDTSACSPCPSGVTEIDGVCWRLGDGNESCDEVCSQRGLSCDEAATQSVGSSGTSAECAALMDLLRPSGAPYDDDGDFDITSCGPAADTAIGCVLQLNFNQVKRVVHDDGPTVCGADNSGGSCVLGAFPRRACACE